MKQKLNDIVNLVKHDRKWQILLAGLVLVILIGMFADNKPRRYSNKPVADINSTTGATTADKASNELLEFNLTQKAELERRIQELETDKQKILERTTETEEQTAKILAKVIERVRGLEESSDAVKGYNAAAVTPENLDANTLESIWEEDSAALVAPPVKPVDKKVAFIAAGDSVRLKLLAGVNAPIEGDPFPVVFQLDSDVTGPDGVTLPLGEARLLAAATGSLIDQRALFRLNKMSMRYPDGSRKVVDVDGWIVGEDGIRGMEGILIDPIGKVLAGELIAGTVAGMGQGISSAQVSTNSNGMGGFSQAVTGDALEYGVGRGVQQAGSNWSGYIKERSKMLVPHVKVLSGRSATAVFSQNVELDGLFESMEDPNLTFASLD